DGSMDLANPQSLNRYSYVGNMPLNFTDPTGQFGEEITTFYAYAFAAGGSIPVVNIVLGAALGLADVSEFLFGGFFTHPQLQGTIHPRPKAPNKGPTNCTGTGRGLAGNTRLVGRQGGIPGQTIQPGTAAVIPQQFGVASGNSLAPYAPYIHGTIGK